jgi:geranylgeranyl pyrophosphate synthase
MKVHSLAPDAPEAAPVVALLEPADRLLLLEAYATLLKVGPETEPRLAAVLRDALGHPGGLVRAQLAFAVMRALGTDRPRAAKLAVGVEYFHAASLLFDDLPAMDDARFRRGRLCPHLVHGEAATMLGALALVNQGYALVWEVLGELPQARRERARRTVEECLGLGGVLNGQAHDLRFGSAAGERAVLTVASGKTVSLVRLALVLAAVAGGAPEAMSGRLDRLATVWGLSYQILDDFKDCLMSPAEAGKTTSRDGALNRPNLPLRAGRSRAMRRVTSLLQEGRTLIDSMSDFTAGCPELPRLQDRLEQERGAIELRLKDVPSMRAASA